jgi:CRISPR-associated protein Cmr2
LKKHPEENPRNYPTEGARIADDLSEIGQAADPRGFIGVVYADGNNMGALLERLPTPAAYKEFSSAIYEELINAVFASLARCLPPLREEVTDGRGELKRVYPFEILSIGGDDVFLIVPAHVALPLAHALAAGVEERLLRHRKRASVRRQPLRRGRHRRRAHARVLPQKPRRTAPQVREGARQTTQEAQVLRRHD